VTDIRDQDPPPEGEVLTMARKTTLTRFALAAAVTGGLLTGWRAGGTTLPHQQQTETGDRPQAEPLKLW
jgi:hypothetical protein